MSLITVDEYKKLTAGDISESAGIERLNALILASWHVMRRRTGYYLLQTTHDKYYDGTGKNTLHYLEAPINSITTLAISNDVISANDYKFYSDDGYIKLINSVFPEGVQNIHLVYSAGWVIASVPTDLKLCQAMIIDMMLAKIGKENLVNQTIGDQQMSYLDEALPPMVMDILESYKMVRV